MSCQKKARILRGPRATDARDDSPRARGLAARVRFYLDVISVPFVRDSGTALACESREAAEARLAFAAVVSAPAPGCREPRCCGDLPRWPTTGQVGEEGGASRAEPSFSVPRDWARRTDGSLQRRSVVHLMPPLTPLQPRGAVWSPGHVACL